MNHIEYYNDTYPAEIADKIKSSAASMDKAANEWWGFFPEAMKGQAPYAEAVKLTNDLSNSLSDLRMISAASNTVYDLDKLTAAYDAFTADFSRAAWTAFTFEYCGSFTSET